MLFDRSIIRQTHPDYNHFLTDWLFFDRSYIGGKDWITETNVFRHARETKEDYQRRLNRVVYTNYCEAVITIFTSYLFSGKPPIMRDLSVPGVNDFYADVDERGATMQDFMEDVATDAQIFGMVGVTVDLPKTDVEIRTEADARANNIRPYLRSYDSPSITNWSVDASGKLNWVRLKESKRDDADPFAKIKKDAAIYRTLTREEWYIHDEGGKEIDFGVYGLGEVPFVPIYFKKHRRKRMIGISQLCDIARINRLLVNIISFIEEFIEIQAFPFLAAPLGIAGADEDTVISTKHIFEYPPEGSPPLYVSPPTDPARFMVEFISGFLRKEIYRMAKLESRELMEQSGVAKQYDFHQTSSAIGRFARNLEFGENQIMTLWARWQGQEWDNSTDYPDDYDIAPVNDDLKTALDVRDLYGDASPTFVSEYLKGLASKIKPKLAEELMRVIEGELEQNAAESAQEGAFDKETS